MATKKEVRRALRDAERRVSKKPPVARRRPKPVGPRSEKRRRLVNLTPHDLHLIVGSETVVIPRESEAGARAHVQSRIVGAVSYSGLEIPEFELDYGNPQGLPDPAGDTLLVVSLVTAQAAAASGRSTDDLRLPHDLVRDARGRVVGCRGLVRVSPSSLSGGPDGE